MIDAMHNAIHFGRVDEVRRRLDDGEDVNSITDDGLTYVMVALYGGQLAIVRLLHSRGADLSRIDGDGVNVLQYAAIGGNVDCIGWVLDNTSIDVNYKEEDDHTPISIALIGCHLMASKLLIERGANLFLKASDGCRVIDRPSGPQVLQHAKTLLWVSVKPLLLLSKAIAIAADDHSNPSPVLLSVDKAFGISGIVRRIASFMKRGGIIVKDPAIAREDEEPDDVKRRVEATLASEIKKMTIEK
jgi:ankyrin repeat protein